jgi:predicted transcriptional regulator
MPEQDNLEFRKKTYKNLKTAFGDDYTLTEEQFNKNMDSDTAFVTKTYKNLKTAFGDDYSIVEEDFKKKVLPISGSPTTSASYQWLKSLTQPIEWIRRFPIPRI